MVLAFEPFLAALWMKEVLAERNTHDVLTSYKWLHANDAFTNSKLIVVDDLLVVGQML